MSEPAFSRIILLGHTGEGGLFSLLNYFS